VGGWLAVDKQLPTMLWRNLRMTVLDYC